MNANRFDFELPYAFSELKRAGEFLLRRDRSIRC
jgi:hypothetical protein